MIEKVRWLPRSERYVRGPRCVYLMEVAGPGGRLLKVGQSENLSSRRDDLTAEGQRRLGDGARAACIAFTYREGQAEAIALESEVLLECSRKWERLHPSEWFAFSEDMRRTVQRQLLADRGKWLKAWNVRQEQNISEGRPMVLLSCSQGVRLHA